MKKIHFLVAAVGVLLSGTLFAQTAQVTGTVSDPSGSVVIQAKVVVTNLDTGVGRESLTNDRGNYIVTALLPGRYEVSAEARGFTPVKRGPVSLAIDQVARVDLTMEVGGLMESVSVREAGILLDAASRKIATVVGEPLVMKVTRN